MARAGAGKIILGAAIVAGAFLILMMAFLRGGIATTVITLCIIAFAAFVATQVFWVRKMDSNEVSNIGDFGQGIASTLTAVALVGAGLIYYYDTQWEPKVSVDIAANGFLLRTEPKQMAIQVVLKISNQSKINLQFREAFVQLGIVDDRNFYPDRHGDLQLTDTRKFLSTRHKLVNAGETDFAYYEMVVPCGATLVRVLTKLPSMQKINGQRLVYERKLLVPVRSLCAGKVSEVHAGSVF